MLRNATLVFAIFLALGSSGLSTSALAGGGDGFSDNHFSGGLRGFGDIYRDGYRGHGNRASGLGSRFRESGAPGPAESATQTVGAATVTAIAVTGNITEAAETSAEMIVAKAIAAAGKGAGGKPGTSESKENRKNKCGVAQHW